MPIYAYKCTECGHPVEVLQKVNDPPLTECPNCHRMGLVKQVTAAGFQLKGSGWYVTDFRDKPSAKKDGSKTETTAESKPDGTAASPVPSKEPSPAPAPESTAGKPPASPPPPSSTGTS